MSVVSQVKYIKEPTDLQCGQAVIAMLSGKTVGEIIDLVGTDRETDLKQMFRAMNENDIKYNKTRIQVEKKEQLPDIALLSLETPRCWHWSLYFKGKFYDPEHGILDDFPQANRKYYWEIIEN